MTFPNAMLIDAQKGGTTSLFNWLSQHPQICAPYSAKEYHFFCSDRIRAQGIARLRSMFKANDGATVGLLGGVNHLYYAEPSAGRISRYLRGMKLIAILRDPAYRAYSAYNYFRKLGQEPAGTFEEAIDLEESRLAGDLNFGQQSRFSYVDHGFYAKQLEIYFVSFPLDKFISFCSKISARSPGRPFNQSWPTWVSSLIVAPC